MAANFSVLFDKSDLANKSIADECIVKWGKPARPSEFVTGHQSATNVSGHNPDHNGVTHAVDIFVGPGNIPEEGGRWLADHLARRADIRTAYVIYADQIASAATGWFFVGEGYGHWDHVHHSTWDGWWGSYCSLLASIYNDASPWGIAAFTNFTPEEEEFFMAFNDDEKTELLVNLQRVRTTQLEQGKQLDIIEFRTARYLDTKISDVAKKVVEYEFPKQGTNEQGKKFTDLEPESLTSIRSELGWADAGNILIRNKVDQVKK